VLIAYGDTQLGWHAQRLCDGRGGGSKLAPIGSSSDGGKPRRDGDRVAIACWLRLPSDGDKPQRNEESSACVCLSHFEACSRTDRAY
ncbi:MAG: hypothetical protein ACK6A7_01895, partial [Planctomycetota bacterium]